MGGGKDSSNIPLCVNADACLLRTNILLESMVTLVKRNPLTIFQLVYWFFSSKADFKQQLAERVDLEPKLLPYDSGLLRQLRQYKEQGRYLVLLSAMPVRYAEQLADHLGLFDEVLASTADRDISGKNMSVCVVERYGEQGFDWLAGSSGDTGCDSHARRVIAANPAAVAHSGSKDGADTGEEHAKQSSAVRIYVKAMRMHQWLKNTLVFVPLMVSHQAFQAQILIHSLIAFIAFGLCASSVYLLNDLLDLSADRKHPSKRNRPLACGNLSIVSALVLIPLLLLAAVGISLLLPAWFSVSLLIYYALTLAYSFRLKQAALVDVLVLAGLYTMRVIAGAAAISVIPSFWLLAFSMFFFYSLALVKRYSELLLLQDIGDKEIFSRGYKLSDMEGLAQSGVASGFLSVLVLALYINSEEVRVLYAYPEVIWLLCPLLLYWIDRVWLLARRSEMHEDPVLFTIHDRRSYLIAAMCLLILWAAV